MWYNILDSRQSILYNKEEFNIRISGYNLGTNKYKNKSTKPEDYDFKAISDSLISNAMKRLEEAKSQAPKIDFGASASESIYDTDISGTNYNFLTKSEPVATLREGARIKNSVYDTLKTTHPEAEIKGVFDNISDEVVERNIPIAKEIIQKRTNIGIDGYNTLNKYPTLQDGLALLYAAGENLI